MPPKPKHLKWWLLFGLVAMAVIGFILIQKAEPEPPALPVAPQPQAAPEPETPEPALSYQSATILELFSPSDPYLTKQLNETALSQQIEQIITTSFVLTNCGIITKEDYRQNFYALINYALTMKLEPDATAAEARVRLIAQSASTSYSMVYSQTPCDSPQLPTLAKQLLEWQKAYLPN